MPLSRPAIRRLAAAAAAVLATTGLAACGGGNQAAPPTTTASLAACPLGALASAAKPVQISFWHSMNRANLDTLTALTDRFNASQKEVHVTLVNQVSYADTLQKYEAGLSTGQLPDLVQIQDVDQQQMVDSRSILPVQSCIDASHYDTSDFVPRVLAYYRIGGVEEGMPFNVSNPVLIYEKNAFRKAGLNPDDPPATLDQLRADAAALVRAGYQGMALKLDPWHLEQWMALAGQDYVNHDNGRSGRATAVSFDDATGQRIFSWLAGMVRDHLAVTNQASGPSQFDNLLGIASGKYGMTIDSSAVLGTIQQVLSSGQYKGLQLGVGPMPGRSGDGGVLVGGAALYISNHASPAKQAAAWKFVQFLDQSDSQATWAAGTGYVPLRQSAAQSPAVRSLWQTSPGFKVAYEQLLQGGSGPAAAGPVIGAYEAVRTAVANAESSMYVSSVDPATALADAAKNADAAITAYNQRVG